MSENLKQGLITCVAAVMFCLAVGLLICRVEIIYSMLNGLESVRSEAIREDDYAEGNR